ncbi:hypothetical protein HNP47_001419 [Brevundimonas vesicularis]|uniref:Uncharacterized protein n=1 Tax=Brevundimonas vesicularis TaxID=41276 RepID=A0A7W9FTS5_BREVE|nr:hypothetical protein [Brevundimonas vesicularis]MBB5771450.1 hypothetical protein [Brevundimonas vesicularis]
MPAPIFVEADLYSPLLHAAALILFAILFPPGTLSAGPRRVARWPWAAAIGLPVIFYTITDIILAALHRGAEAQGESGLPYRAAQVAILVLIVGIVVLMLRRKAASKSS